MKFVKTEDLKIGMRLAKPIYNNKGVLLYDRNSKLTQQGIESVHNFKLIGIYVLEPAEPLPPPHPASSVTLMAAASANLKDLEPTVSPRLTTWCGRGMIVVRSLKKKGRVTVETKSTLPTAKTVIQSVP